MTEIFRARIREAAAPLVEELEAAEAGIPGRTWARTSSASPASRWTASARRSSRPKRKNSKMILPEAFAAVREASKRTIGLRHYDVQLIGGMVLHGGTIAEMKTGEGKTLVATLPLYLNSLTGRGAHLVTPNDYLSKVGLAADGAHLSLAGRVRGRDPKQRRRARTRAASCTTRSSRRRMIVSWRCARSRAAMPIEPTSPTAPTTNSASTICATTWCTAWTQLHPARVALRHRRRGRQYPHRRSAHAADHLRRGPRKLQLLR